MSLAATLYPPPERSGWDEWSHANFQHHLAIETALLQVRGVQATPFRIWPVGPGQFTDWLEQHQRSHTLFCEVLGIQGIDLTDLNWEDRTKKDFWMFAHFQQHQAAAQILGLSIL